MSRLNTEYLRLYQPADAAPSDGPCQPGRDGRVRAMVLGLRQPADWSALSAVWRGVQADHDWPAPAIAVNGVDAFELWFSLAEPVPAVEAATLLQALACRYLPEVRPARLHVWPAADDARWTAARIPALQAASGGWSAFVSPDLPAVFGDEPTLDLQPGEDAQAELLSRLASIQPDDWRAALVHANAKVPDRSSPVPESTFGSLAVAVAQPSKGTLNGNYQDPRAFLRDVMNDTTVALELRIQAAKALLPSAP